MRKALDLLDIHLLETEARRRCAAAGVHVSFKADIPTACYNYKTHCVYLPALSETEAWDETDYRQLLIHEIGHSNRKEVVSRADGIDMSSKYGRLLNAVEDEVMERNIAKEWYGDGVSLSLGHRRLVERDTKFVLEKTQGGVEPDDDSTKWTAAYLTTQRARTWDNISKSERELLEDVLPEKILKLADELKAEGWVERLKKTETADEVFKYTTDLHKRLYPEDPDPEKSARAGKKATGTAKEKGGEGEGKPGPSPHWTLLKPAEDTFTNPAAGKHGSHIDYDDYYYSPKNRPTLLDTDVLQPSNGRYIPHKVPDLPVAGQLRIALLSEGKAKFKTELTSGKLDKRKLARLAMPIVPGTDSWRKVFRRRIPAKKLNTAIQILVDGSGSMSGEKIKIAAASAAATVKALTGPLRIPTEVLGFSSIVRKNTMTVIKDFTEVVHPDDINKRALGLPMAGNSDGESVMWAAERLTKRKEKRKIMLVLSDGCPADGTGKQSPGDTLSWAIRTCRKRGVEMYGIGIMDHNVQKFYGNDSKVISDLRELAPALVTTLAGKLHR